MSNSLSLLQSYASDSDSDAEQDTVIESTLQKDNKVGNTVANVSNSSSIPVKASILSADALLSGFDLKRNNAKEVGDSSNKHAKAVSTSASNCGNINPKSTNSKANNINLFKPPQLLNRPNIVTEEKPLRRSQNCSNVKNTIRSTSALSNDNNTGLDEMSTFKKRRII